MAHGAPRSLFKKSDSSFSALQPDTPADSLGKHLLEACCDPPALSSTGAACHRFAEIVDHDGVSIPVAILVSD